MLAHTHRARAPAPICFFYLSLVCAGHQCTQHSHKSTAHVHMPPLQTTTSSALWNEFEGDAADWEKHEVWTSVNLKVRPPLSSLPPIFPFCVRARLCVLTAAGYAVVCSVSCGLEVPLQTAHARPLYFRTLWPRP